MSDRPAESPSPAWPRLALFGLLALAGALRFTGLGWGLRHPAPIDEYYFVGNVRMMIEQRDLNHRFFEYPGLFFYILAPVLAFFPGPPYGSPQAYLAARGVVAAFGVASVALAYVLARDRLGPLCALFAAALLAVSPLEVETAHMVRPDAVLETFVLLALIAWRRPAGTVAWSGAALGAATAVKFSGVLLAPAWLARALARRAGGAQVLRVGLASLAAFAVLSPFTLLSPRAALAGIWAQASYHYVPHAAPASLASGLAFYLGALGRGLGGLGLPLCGAGAVLALLAAVEWIDLVALPLSFMAVFATADVRESRFLVPVLGAAAVLGALALHRLATSRPRLAALVGSLALIVPLGSSLTYLRAILQPQARDLAADWLEANLKPGARVLTTLAADLGLDRHRFEVLRVDRLAGEELRVAEDMDAVVTGPGDDRSVLRRVSGVKIFQGETQWAGPRVRVLLPARGFASRYEPVSLVGASLRASAGLSFLRALRDDASVAGWRAGRGETPAWIEVELPAARAVARIELELGPAPWEPAERLRVRGGDGQGPLRRLAAVQGRASVPDQVGPRRSQVLLLDPTPVRVLRIEASGRRPSPWSVAELRLHALREGLAPSEPSPR